MSIADHQAVGASQVIRKAPVARNIKKKVINFVKPPGRVIKFLQKPYRKRGTQVIIYLDDTLLMALTQNILQNCLNTPAV